MIFLLLCVILLFVLTFFYGTRTFDYWRKKGVKHDKPVPLFGTDFPLVTGNTSFGLHYGSMYNRYPNEKLVGFYRGTSPCVILRDPDLIKRVLTMENSVFYPRGLIPTNDDLEPMFQNLFSADGDVWKLLRTRLSPMFSSGKLKAMFPLIVSRADKLQALISVGAENGETLDGRDLMARYTTDFIADCVFGIEIDSLDDHNTFFRQLGKRIFTIKTIDILRGGFKVLVPFFGKYIRFIAPEIENGITYLMTSVMKQRNYKPSGRNDFIDMLLEIREKGTIVGESIEHVNPDGTAKIAYLELTEEIMVAQLFIFFAAGFETSSSASGFALHLLAFHPEIQKKAQEEIDQILVKYENKLCYSAVQDMQYLEMILQESLRILSPVGVLNRKSAKKYTFPGTNVTIDAGVGVFIPIHALHNDPNHFEDPTEFRPERFHPDVKHKINKFTYLPFGDGQRACIGARLGVMQTLTGLAVVLHKFDVLPAPTSRRYPILGNGNLTQNIVGGLPILLKKRKLT